MKRIPLIYLLVILLSGCFASKTEWDGSFDNLPEIGKSCALSWNINIFSIEGVETEIDKLDFVPNKILLLKSASANSGSYSFAAIFEGEGELTTIYGDPGYRKPLVIKQSDDAISELLLNATQVEEQESSVIKGRTHNLSHIPCNFLYYKSGTDIRKFAFIGLFEPDEQNPLVSSIIDLVWDHSIHEWSDNVLPMPPEAKLEALHNKIKQDVFFELDSLKNDSR